MYHPYQNQVAKQIVKERREHADSTRQVVEARSDHSELWIRLREWLAHVIIGRIDQRNWREMVAEKKETVSRLSALVDE